MNRAKGRGTPAPSRLQVLEVPGYRQEGVAGLLVGAAPRRGMAGISSRLAGLQPQVSGMGMVDSALCCRSVRAGLRDFRPR